MEFRDKLLSSEIRHITDMVNMLSYELVIIQDFMTQQFGSGFKRFRDRHLLSCETQDDNFNRSTPTTRVTRNITNRISACDGERTSQLERNSNRIDNAGTLDANSDNVHHLAGVSSASCEGIIDPLAEPMQIQGDDFEETLNSQDEELSQDEIVEESDVYCADTKGFYKNMDPNFSESECFDSDNSSDEGKTNTGSKKEDLGGRKKIWKYFDCVRLPGGKKLAKCKNCHYQVSAVPKRLEKHYQRCVLGKAIKTITPVSTPKERISVAKVESEEEQERKFRKPLGIVWSYFNKTMADDGRTIITCKSCEKKVSNHSTRMSRHLQNCTKSTSETS